MRIIPYPDMMLFQMQANTPFKRVYPLPSGAMEHWVNSQFLVQCARVYAGGDAITMKISIIKLDSLGIDGGCTHEVLMGTLIEVAA